VSDKETAPQQFRTKSVVKWALRFAEDGSNWTQVHKFMNRQCPANVPTFYAEIPTLEGTMMAKRGDWIVKGIEGEFYPCKPEIFAKCYEPVAEECTAQAPTQLAEALKTYGANHIWDCDALNKWKKLPCDCGFAALLRPQGPG
jgi:hypothetical protein